MERWRFKGILKKMLIFIYIYEVFMFFLSICLTIKLKLEWVFIPSFLLESVIFWLIPFLCLGLIYLLTNGLKNNTNYKGYYREIDNMYPPAIVSYLLDNVVEKKEDILATILNLSIKKALTIEKDSSGIKIHINEQNCQYLYYHEEYIINKLKNNCKIDFKKFYDKVIYDCEYNKLIYRNNSPLMKFFIVIRTVLAAIGIFGLGIAARVGAPNLFLYFLIFAILAYIGKFAIKTHDKTSKGIEFAAKAKMLKNYLRDYTLVKEKDYDYIALLEKYIPYALALGEAIKIEDLHIAENKLMKNIVQDTNLIDEFMNEY